MAKPEIHAESSAKKFGGRASDYVPIHNMFDSSKSIIADNRHRALFHHSHGIFTAEKMFGIDFGELERLQNKFGWSEEEVEAIVNFKNHCTSHGTCIKNSDGRRVPVRSIGEQHCLEDFGGRFIPSPSDYLNFLEMKMWMNNGLGASPPSCNLLTSRNGADND